jgi:antitoxin component YwqK of YwqJK toxin-antitoxin module
MNKLLITLISLIFMHCSNPVQNEKTIYEKEYINEIDTIFVNDTIVKTNNYTLKDTIFFIDTLKIVDTLNTIDTVIIEIEEDTIETFFDTTGFYTNTVIIEELNYLDSINNGYKYIFVGQKSGLSEMILNVDYLDNIYEHYEYYYEDGLIQGEAYSYNRNDSLKSIVLYKNNLRDGLTVDFHESDTSRSCFYENNVQRFQVRYYDGVVFDTIFNENYFTGCSKNMQ